MSIKSNLENIKSTLNEGTTLVCVSKYHTEEEIMEAYNEGIRDFGENKVQDMVKKAENLPKDIRWHLIGHLQTNKVKYIIDKVYMIHSVDSVKLLDEIERQAEKHGIDKMRVLIQVNITNEETKSGIDAAQLGEILEYVNCLKHVKVCGLMTILSKFDSDVANRLHFRDINNKFIDISKNKYDNITMEFLSMGMSGDYISAIEEGSNMVRVGTAIFGMRDYSQKK